MEEVWEEKEVVVRLASVGCPGEDGVAWADGLGDMTHLFEDEESSPGIPGRRSDKVMAQQGLSSHQSPAANTLLLGRSSHKTGTPGWHVASQPQDLKGP